MRTVFYGAALLIAVLWPARLAGPLDGAPLDSAVEAVVLGLALPALIWFHPPFLRTRVVRVLVVALLVWKALTHAAVTQDGWCVRFALPHPIFVDDTRVPHSWDMRADWRAAVPACSAVMTRDYPLIERFPAWFYNLPPANLEQPSQITERPPYLTTQLDVTGYLHVEERGRLSIAIDDGVQLAATIDGEPVTDVVNGVYLDPGSHRVALSGTLTGSQWRLMPAWNGQSLWTGAAATLSAPRAFDLAIRPWGRWVTVIVITAILGAALASLMRLAGGAMLAASGAAALTIAAAASGRAALMRATPIALLYAASFPLPRRLQNLTGMLLLVGIPFLALFAVLGAPQAGLFTWYSVGDDWWMFQRYAYRIYLQGYWLEGGEPTFWFQPFYRWIAGGLHMVFGDSSVGELFWDAGCTLVGAAFAFQMTRVIAGFRWGIAAAVVLLALMLLGPAWYLFGRGLSEISSMAFLYAAALFLLRARRGHMPSLITAGVLAVLSVYTRLNNLPMVLALLAFAWPPRTPIATIFVPQVLMRTMSRPLFAMLSGCIGLGVALFCARTYYYTGVFSFTEGTQAGHLSVWQPPDGGGTIASNVIGSVLMVLTMSDPPAADPRAVPVVVGVGAAIAGLLGVGRLRWLPLGAVALCLAGMSATVVARGSAYPGRFSVNLLPVTSALATMAIALLLNKVKSPICRRSPLA